MNKMSMLHTTVSLHFWKNKFICFQIIIIQYNHVA